VAANSSKTVSMNRSSAVAARTRGQQVPRHGIVGRRGDPSLHDRDRFGYFPERAMRHGQQTAGLFVLGAERGHLAVAHHGFAQPVGVAEQDAQVVVGGRVLRVQANRGAIGDLGLGNPPLGLQQHADVVVGLGMARVERHRALIRIERLVDAALRLVDDAEVVVALGPVGRQFQAALDHLDAHLAAARLVGEHPRIMEQFGVQGLHLHHPAIHVGRIGQQAAPLVVAGDGEGLVEGDLALLWFRLVHDGVAVVQSN
jgi:hypothetical protein